MESGYLKPLKIYIKTDYINSYKKILGIKFFYKNKSRKLIAFIREKNGVYEFEEINYTDLGQSIPDYYCGKNEILNLKPLNL